MSVSNFNILSRLGEGSYACVFKALRKTDRNIYAIKRVKLEKLSEFEIGNTLTEVRVLASIDHPNILGFKQAFVEESYLYIVTDFCEFGDLQNIIEKRLISGRYFSEEEIWDIFTDIVKGLRVLHDLNIVHRDIKSANIFLSENGPTKIGDMNVSTVAKQGIIYSQAGTPYYASPEIWKGEPYNFKCDIWSLGVVLYQLITLSLPFKANSMKHLYEKVIKGDFPTIPNHYSDDLAELVKLLLRADPHRRPTCNVILDYPVIKRRLCGLPSADNSLMETLIVPKKISEIQSILPAAKYEQKATSLSPQKKKKVSSYPRHSEDMKSQRILKKSTKKLNLEKPLRGYRSKKTIASKIKVLREQFSDSPKKYIY